jgi:hypothetical protein
MEADRGVRVPMRSTKTTVFFLPLFVACPLAAQEYARHNITFGVGGGVPQGTLSSYMKSSPSITVDYGYRFHKYFQADLGLDITFGAAQVRDFLTTDIGYVRVKDREYFLPFGGRAIWPVADGKVLLSVGGGGTWIKYNTRVSQPSYYYRVDCPICSERTGLGYYGLLNATYFLDYAKHFRVGVTSRMIRGHTDGSQVGDIPAFRTSDHWVNVFGEVGFSF